jgi:hypothetical protein
MWVIESQATRLPTFTLIGDFSHIIYDDGIAMRPVQGALLPDGQGFPGYYKVNENTTSFIDGKQSGVTGSATISLPSGFAPSGLPWECN